MSNKMAINNVKPIIIGMFIGGLITWALSLTCLKTLMGKLQRISQI